MKRDEISRHSQTEYFQICECCGLTQLILIQSDNFCEYETEIYLQCQCGEFVPFVLPVN
jgi:hypothetical protein